MRRYSLIRTIIFLLIGTFLLSLSEASVFAANNERDNEGEELKLEAEEATLTGLTVQDEVPGYSGTGYVGNFSEEDASVTFTITVPDTALYTLRVGYGGLYGEGKHANLRLNGEAYTNFKMGDGFGEASIGKVLLNEGTNTITVTPNWTHFAIDYIKLSLAPPPNEHEVKKQLINPNATKETKALFNYLVDNFGENIISGQQDDANNDLADVKYIKELTGKTPAILGLDLMDYSPSRVERGAESHDVDLALEWDEQGGIVAFAWHWNAPKDLLDTEDQPWWSGFYTDATTFDVKYAMNDPESEDYQVLIRDIDTIADELKRLQDANVPVLWRPLHEAEGGWFWWGAKGPDPTIRLWKLMYDRLTNYHHLNNLIWVWNSIDPEWYPGDDYVDVVSFDSYPGEYNYSPQNDKYEALVDLSSNRKLIAMTENGPIPDPDMLNIYNSMYSYFTTWIGLVTSNNSSEHLQKIYNHEKVITLEELPDLKTYGVENSSDASLQALTVNKGVLTPTFSKDVKEYYLEVTETVEEITLTPVASSDGATITINGNEDLTSAIKLSLGDNVINVEVTAEDGTKSSYLLHVKRLASFISTELVQGKNHLVLPEDEINNLADDGLLELSVPNDKNDIEVVFYSEQLEMLLEKNTEIQIVKKDLKINFDLLSFETGSPLTLRIAKIEAPELEKGDLAATKLYDLTFKQNSQTISQFSSGIQLSFLVENSNENQKIYYWDVQESIWEEIGGTIENNWITARTDHFTIFSVFDVGNMGIDKENQENKDTNKQQEQPIDEQTKNSDENLNNNKTNDSHTIKYPKAKSNLPDTASSTYNWLLLGFIVLVLGIGSLVFTRKKVN
ncbi:glycosyl hydrolase [Gracilibacillus suaedae]|uniref:glycosyl hydrolase n=1 Tax=Gracilibacillus suaedae TaxID=2820273 RepID=UPI001ABEE6E6|nr:glycosyl hydrolase [Gracilibacillus suaedae]